MSMITLVATCLWFLLVSNFTGANQLNINCLQSIKSQVEDPNDYLSSWVFSNTTQGFICKFSGVSCWHDDESRVLSIKLSGYGLIGEFPQGIKDCSDLVGLDLSRNNFSGALPSNMTDLVPLLTILDLSYNQFSDEIPPSLSNITYLNTLMLQHNQFTGPLPSLLAQLRRLSRLSVANNRLTGPVPDFDSSLNFGLDSFANNPDLCGSPLDACPDPEEGIMKSGMIGAMVGAAIFAPVSAFLDWVFFNGKKETRR
ncbi:hypothetical protein AALP_AA8G175500 [Arabis alpina]|uniref:Leucine-rich repeat-containing N-terminal plant-type domain-containing protein n=1 Tax=Arabis alpina TaxID=50452 RepID=A0A087G7N8_ARAAL|nr:hypothetical protein AALP_AA8G175500 [Arabis alpina]